MSKFAPIACAASLLLAQSATAQTLKPTYVGMGSSFAAGVRIGAAQADSPARCARTQNNYASLLAASQKLTLVDMSCSGAVTQDLLQPSGELPAQLDAVTSATRLVTMTIGGNDLAYTAGMFGASCRLGITDRPMTCPPTTAPDSQKLAALEGNFAKIFAQIRAKAPKARIILVQYLTIVPEKLCAATPMSEADAAASRQTGALFAKTLAKIARSQRVEILNTNTLSRHHTACDPQPWSNGFPKGSPLANGIPWHPTAAGHAAIAAALQRKIGARKLASR